MTQINVFQKKFEWLCCVPLISPRSHTSNNTAIARSPRARRGSHGSASVRDKRYQPMYFPRFSRVSFRALESRSSRSPRAKQCTFFHGADISDTVYASAVQPARRKYPQVVANAERKRQIRVSDKSPPTM